MDKFCIFWTYQVSELWKSQTALCSLCAHLLIIICRLLFPSPGPVRQNRVASVAQISFELGRRGWQPVFGCQRARAPAVDAGVGLCAPSKCQWRAVNQPLSRGTSLGFALWGGQRKENGDGGREEKKKLERHPLILQTPSRSSRVCVCLLQFSARSSVLLSRPRHSPVLRQQIARA